MSERIVIIGGGFAGMNVARRLEKDLPRQSARIDLIDRDNFSLYTPFLPEAAAGTLEPRHVITPLREILQRTHVRRGSVLSHKRDLQQLKLQDGTTLDYDLLVVALGSVSRVAKIPGIERAVGFKNLDDALWLRNRVIERLEQANSSHNEHQARSLLSFVFVGAGYAGLEALAELQDFAVEAISSYPLARLHGMRWILLDSAGQVLPEINSSLARYASRQLRGRGVEIYLRQTLASIEERSVVLADGSSIPAETVVWTAGVRANPILANLDLPLDERGRVVVDDNLAVSEHIYALGDCAAVPEPGGYAPPTAQHATRQARVVANNVISDLVGEPRKKYRYRSRNAFVNLGRYKAVGRIGPLRLSGFFAWWLARSYHLSQIPGLSRKIRLVLDWTISLPWKRDLADLGPKEKPHLGE